MPLIFAPARRRAAPLALLALLLAVPLAAGKKDGISGYSGKTPGVTCTTCHNGGSRPTVQLLGPEALAPGTTGEYLLRISGGQQTEGGLDVAASDGTLVADRAGIELLNGEVVHTRPRRANSDGDVIFTFAYTAPATLGAQTLWGAGNSTNASGTTSGDAPDTDVLGVEVRELALEASPDDVPPGGTVTLRTFGGDPFNLVLLAAVGVGGAPIFQPLVLGSFDVMGELVIAAPAPPELSGLNVTFQSIGFGTISSKAVPTNEETVTFQ